MSDLNRFIKAQDGVFEKALLEIKNGKKESHWIWYIFPQIIGLGKSETAIYYSLKSIQETEEFINNELLFTRLNQISNELIKMENKSAVEIFGFTDSLKLKSCMTLFDYMIPNSIFGEILELFFNGKRDFRTLDIISKS